MTTTDAPRDAAQRIRDARDRLDHDVDLVESPPHTTTRRG